MAKPKSRDLTPEEFAAALSMHRSRLGISQHEAAKLCSVSLRTWSHWEIGNRSTLAVTMEGALARLAAAPDLGSQMFDQVAAAADAAAVKPTKPRTRRKTPDPSAE